MAQKRRARSLEELSEIQGKTFNLKQITDSIKSYKPRPTDVIISPFGKSGTTWTQQIFHTLRTRGDMDFDDISRVVPWIEMGGRLAIDLNAEQKADPRGFKSHLEYDQLPGGARYINVIRDPLDAAYSAFKFMEGWYLEVGAVDPEVFVLAGTKEARYFKHFANWWPHRNDENVLLLCYEHMRDDHEGTIRKIAKFAGIAVDDELMAITLEHSSLTFMQQHKNRFDDAMLRAYSEQEGLPEGSDSAKVRAGRVGEFQFSEAVIERFNVMWRQYLEPVTGFPSYASLIASLRSGE
ncbi:MAG: sulfotransferase domain-containing protein [Pseudomonadales bacterium]